MMLDSDALERLWTAAPPSRKFEGKVLHLVLRLGDGAHAMRDRITLDPQTAIDGDRWATAENRHPDAQISLIEHRVVSALTGGDDSCLHLPGDNLVVDLDLGTEALPVGARLTAGTALLEITDKVHAGCAKFRARLGDDALRWVNDHDHRPRRLRGVYARILRAGTIALGDPIRVLRSDPDLPR